MRPVVVMDWTHRETDTTRWDPTLSSQDLIESPTVNYHLAYKYAQDG